jgi:hypothetical protein
VRCRHARTYPWYAQAVIQVIEHSEPPALRDTDLLAEQLQHAHVDAVIHLLHSQSHSQLCNSIDEETEREALNLLEYNRYQNASALL